MRIVILGGDGYLGWPQAMYFSARGHDVTIVDNLQRRHFDQRHGFDSLLPLVSLHQRVATWEVVTGHKIHLAIADITDYAALSEIIYVARPDAVVHFAEQRSAPFSMIDRAHAAFTMQNNVIGNLNLLYALHEHAPECHLIKLGTMGEYGTPNIDIEEGWLDVEHKGRRDRLPFPKQPGSWYHASKVHDSVNIHLACRLWGLKATDLNQGVVYGVETDETQLHADFATRFDYDQVYGTALNRFCVQAAVGYPLTVYGRGGQTRGFINLCDTMRCIELAAANPATAGEYRVFNQFTEQFSVRELATIVMRAGAELGFQVDVKAVPNPRVEKEEHYYRAVATELPMLGLQPHLLADTVLKSLMEIALTNCPRVDPRTIAPTVYWKQGRNTL